MRKISADYIFPVTSPPIKNGIIVLENNGKVKDLIDPKKDPDASGNIEFYKGILAPGFVNAHTHLELSHLNGKIQTGTGLPGFLHKIRKLRVSEESVIKEAAIRGIEEMERNGIVAAGDISNTSITFPLKINGKIRFHTFVEVFGLIPEEAKEKISEGIKLLNLIEQQFRHPASLSPHAPYSASRELLAEISKYINNNPGPVTFHNQECPEEIEMFESNKGKLKYILDKTGSNMKKWKPPGKSSLLWMISNIPEKIKILPVHNTYTTVEDVKSAGKRSSPVYWTLCPGANLYIEKRIPDIDMLMQYTDNIIIGTDSLASNNTLSILNELIIIHDKFPDIPLEILIRWATLTGAQALNMDAEIGSFEKGKKPGINLISGFDLHKMKLTNESNVKPII